MRFPQNLRSHLSESFARFTWENFSSVLVEQNLTGSQWSLSKFFFQFDTFFHTPGWVQIPRSFFKVILLFCFWTFWILSPVTLQNVLGNWWFFKIYFCFCSQDYDFYPILFIHIKWKNVITFYFHIWDFKNESRQKRHVLPTTWKKLD